MKENSISELEQLILSAKPPIVRKAVKDRKYMLNNEFWFTDESIRHILTFNDALFAQMHELYQHVLEIKTDLDLLILQGRHVYENYSILAELYLQASDEFHENYPILGKVIEESKMNWCISANCKGSLDSREVCCMEDLNWNIEQLSFFKEYNHYICYATHSLFVDDESIALVDIQYLTPEMIQSNIEIHL
jgi:hypothetical protein